MNEAPIELIVLDLVDEDFYGVWEVGWRVNNVLGVDSAINPGEAAAVIASLRDRHLVGIFVREGIQGAPVPLDKSDFEIDLNDPAAWNLPLLDCPQYLLGPWEPGA